MTDLSSQPSPIQTVYGWYRDGKLIVNRAYQRKLVWTLLERQKLIDSLLNKYPIPLVLLAEPEGAPSTRYEIIDGLQRLHTILSFIEGAFPTETGAYFDVREFARAKDEQEKGAFKVNASDNVITRAEVSSILDYNLPVSIIRDASSATITEVFGRINTYGHRLSEQEQRQAGQLTELARFVRTLSSEIRGDVSVDTLPLYQMPEISVELTKSKAGYAVQATEVYWVRQGVLRSTDLRDSMDEQLIADIAICATYGIIERSKESLDQAFVPETETGRKVAAALTAHGTERLAKEVKYCLEVIGKVVSSADGKSLSKIVFEKPTNNSFATIFAAIFMAVYELVFKDNLLPSDFPKARSSLENIYNHLDTSRAALSSNNRRLNVNTIKGRLRDAFSPGDIAKAVFSGNRELDIRNVLKRSRIETANFEMKQGACTLSPDRAEHLETYAKVIETISAIANNGANHDGAVFIGVADDERDAKRVLELDGLELAEIDDRYIVGVEREAKFLGLSLEAYFQRWRDKIANSALEGALKTDVLSKLNICGIDGRQVIIVTIPPQSSPNFLAGKLFLREGDQTKEASAEKVLAVAKRFAS